MRCAAGGRRLWMSHRPDLSQAESVVAVTSPQRKRRVGGSKRGRIKTLRVTCQGYRRLREHRAD